MTRITDSRNNFSTVYDIRSTRGRQAAVTFASGTRLRATITAARDTRSLTNEFALRGADDRYLGRFDTADIDSIVLL